MKTTKATQDVSAQGAGITLSLDDAVRLNNALSSKGLKSKHVGGENYLKIIRLKTLLRNEMKTVEETHVELAEEFEMEPVGNGQYKNTDKEKIAAFVKKYTEVNKKWRSPVLELNFVPEKELKEFCMEQDVEIESVLYEYLMLNEVKK